VARQPRWWSTARAAQSEAALAVRLYNDAAENRGFEAFVVHMHLAWLYLLHARFTRDNVEYRYRRVDQPRFFVRVDGEYKRWELARCAQECWQRDHPVRKNLEFFIALRNRIEHRHAELDLQLSLSVSGHAQALLLNFEDHLTATFGSDWSMATRLRFPVFVGTFTTEGQEVLRKLRNTLPADLRRFISEFHSGLPDGTEDDPRFEMRLRVVQERVLRDPAALSMRFTRWDDMSDTEKAAVHAMGKRGHTVIREQKRLIVGHGLLRPQEAERRAAAGIPFAFNSYHFLRAWQLKKIRPPRGDAHPERTDEKYCVYDALSGSYGYTEAWVAWLVKNCSTSDGFLRVTGRSPQARAISD
jgi:hypothetical protein